MTVNNASPLITYPGNGATTLFTFPMATPDVSAITVFVTDLDGSVRELTPTEFSVSLNPLVGANPTPQGGSVVYNPGGTPLPAGAFITISRQLDAIQDTSISNQSIVYPPVIEQEFDYLTMLFQQGVQDVSRSLKVPPTDPPPADLPPIADRANQSAFFDANGDLTAGLPLVGTAMVSAVMQPVIAANTIPEAQTLFGLNKDPRLITANYLIVPDDNRRTISMEGAAFYTVTANDPTAYPTYFVTLFVNNDSRAKLMNIFGYPVQFIVYPMQQVWLARGPNGWLVSRPGRWFTRSPQNFFVDPVLGSDSNDGLATGSGAFLTINKAVTIVENDVDGDFTINLANGIYNLTEPIVLSKRPSGSTGYKITGNIATPTNVKIAGPTASPLKIWFIVSGTAVATLRGIQFVQGAGAVGAYCMWALNGGVLNIGDIVFTPTPNLSGHVVCWAATVNVIGNYHVSASTNAAYHMGSFYNGVINFGTLGGPTIVVTLDGAVQFTPYGWYLAELNATIVTTQTTNYVNAGFAVGTPKGNAVYNAIVNAGSGAIPGDLPAAASNGGFFF